MKRMKRKSEFLKEKFAEYYSNPDIEFPDRFSTKECGFLFFDRESMLRHLSFSTEKELFQFLKERVPSHSYYSSAYYKNPSAPTMEKKGWNGAEIIFDLDADHIPGAEKMSYEEMLGEVKKEFRKLIEDFLMRDFGFDIEEMKLYFSGGRGYHCHIINEKVIKMGSRERREIIDYISGIGLDERSIFRERIIDTKMYGKKVYPSSKRLEMPRPDEPAWKGRVSRWVIEFTEKLYQMKKEGKKEGAIDYLLKFEGIGEKGAEKFLDELSDDRVKRIKLGILDQSPSIRKIFLKKAIKRSAIDLSTGKADEPVTTDIKRLIRLPGSIHGKTGLKVEKVTIDGLKDFDPLNDAVVFGDEPVKVKIVRPTKIRMKGEKFNLDVGEIEVPEYLAILLVGRGNAVVLNKR